ncbi:MAG: (R)-hydratase, partial [Desulfuromonadales bacterium]|nr:(R)-hydratase [Desulfuromonadales bacterium]NIS41732.1 (R)-hydratase [Desulfuromonadales bacterium]
EARVTLREVDKEKKRILVDTVCTVRGKVVLDGEAKLMVAKRAQAEASNESKTVAAE